jgi:hypothetical protein
LPKPRHRTFLLEAWAKIAGDVFRNRDWNDAALLRRLAPRVMEEPIQVLCELFSSAVRSFSRLSRGAFYDYLAAMAPIIHRLNGRRSAAETWKACADVSRWWP